MSDLIRNERTKLTATLLNATASGMFITGIVAPAVAVAYGVPGPAQAAPWLFVLMTLAWLATGVVIHALARGLLGGLR